VELPLERGDLALVFTDALIEIPVAAEEPLGLERLVEIVRGLDPERPGELISDLLAAIREAASGDRFDDDTSVMLLRANESRTRLADNLLAPLRYLGDLLRFGFRRPRAADA
jgi:serine phosphatase RsbU (regulator of sigma subunit)